MDSKFFKIIVHEEESMPTLLGICAGFENGEWRGMRLADYLFNCIPDFCLSYSETHEVDSVEWMDKIRKSVAMIYNTPKYHRTEENLENCCCIISLRIYTKQYLLLARCTSRMVLMKQ